MRQNINRRAFIRGVIALSAVGLGMGAGACAPRPAVPEGEPPSLPTATSEVAPDPAAGEDTLADPTLPAATRAAAGEPAASEEPQADESAPTATGEVAYLAVARGPGADPGELTRRAIAALGGIERFVKAGNRVVVKPNMCNAYHGPEYASTTNPEVVSAIVALALGAGAKSVEVMDFPFGGTPQNAYTKSGIEEAVKAAGGEMVVMTPVKFRKVAIPQGKLITEWEVAGDVLDADVLINVPIAKHHSSARLTLGMKNLMGVVSDRNGFHSRGLHQCIADVNTAVRSHLTVLDAVRILTANGPTGGNLNDVKQMDTVIASADIVAADAYATTLFGLTADDVDYIAMGAEMGLGMKDLSSVKVEEIAV